MTHLTSAKVRTEFRMIAVTDGAVADDTALRAMTLHTRGFGRHDDVRCVGALAGLMAFRAIDAGMF